MGKLRSSDDPSGEATFRYTIENFSDLEDHVWSKPFYFRKLKWHIYARTKDNKQNLGFFLQCDHGAGHWFCNVKADLRIIPQKEGCKPISKRFRHVFYSKENDWGFDKFSPWSDITDPEKGFIKDDTIILEVQILAAKPRETGYSEEPAMNAAKAFARYFYIDEGWAASNVEEGKLTKMLEELDSPEATKTIDLIRKGSLKSLDVNLFMLGIRLALDSEKRKIEKFLDGKSEPNEKPTTESKEELK